MEHLFTLELIFLLVKGCYYTLRDLIVNNLPQVASIVVGVIVVQVRENDNSLLKPVAVYLLVSCFSYL